MNPKWFPKSKRPYYLKIWNEDRFFDLVMSSPKNLFNAAKDLLPPATRKGFRPGSPESMKAQIEKWFDYLRKDDEKAWRAACRLWIRWVFELPPTLKGQPTLNELLL